MSNRSYDTKLKNHLWNVSGGMCEFEGCRTMLSREKISRQICNLSQIAHIVADSPNGPRGNENSEALSKDSDNLMMLCSYHHKLIDDNPNEYTVKRLLDMKRTHEQKVQNALYSTKYPETEIVLFESPIKGIIEATVNYDSAVEAVLDNGYCASTASSGIPINIPKYGLYIDQQYWELANQDIEYYFRHDIQSFYRKNPDVPLSVFPLAPIPMIIKLGFLLGDKKVINIFQKFREPDTWKWLSKDKTNQFFYERIQVSDKNKTIAIVISLSANVDFKRVKDVLDVDIIYHIYAEKKGVYCIKSKEDLKAFWLEYQKVCEDIKYIDKVDEVSVFPAIPVSAAFEIGRRYMIGIYPVLTIYDDCEGFFKTLKIGGEKDGKK